MGKAALAQRALAKTSSMARIRPGAPSLAARMGSFMPRALRSRKHSRALSVSSLLAG
jgi:hypothetical protein